MIWFDMDGVLCLYERDAYHPNSPNTAPAFITKDKHYFADCTPDNSAVALFRRLVCEDVPVGIVSSVWQENKGIRDEQILDKTEWFLKHVFISNHDIPVVFSGHDKSYAIKTAGYWNDSDITSNILIDDYNINLNQWLRTGATAVKYLNGINSPWSGYSLSHTDDPDSMFAYLSHIFERSF